MYFVEATETARTIFWGWSSIAVLSLIERIVERCDEAGTDVSFCGEDARRPVEALCFAAMGLKKLSMRPASIGPVKSLLRRVDLAEAREVISSARESGVQSVRQSVMDWLATQARNGNA